MNVEIRKVAVLTDDSGHETVISDQQVVAIVEAALAKEADNKPAKKPPVRKPAKANEQPKEKKVPAPKHNDYGVRPCDGCGQDFHPRSGRAKFCDACKAAGVNRKRGSAKTEKKCSDALVEVRKYAAEANLGGHRA